MALGCAGVQVVQVVQAAQILSVVLVSALLSTVWLTLIAPLQRRQMQDAADLEASEKEARNLALVAEHTSDGVSIISRTGRIEWLNAAFARHSGFAADDLVGRDFRDILGRRDANPKHIDDLDHAWDKGRTFRGELENRRSDEAPFWTDFELIPITDSETGVSKFISVERNVTERRIASVRLSEATPTEDYHARHDVLTGLPNRQYLLAHLALSLNAAAENGTRVAVFNIDLDHFRPINDTLGQAAGDFVLKTSAKRMRHVLRNNDFLARVGCDEFVVVAPIGDESEVIARIGARLIENVQQTMYFDGEECKVGASIGIAISDAAGSTPDDLILAADIALYEAKRAGRNGYKMFLEEMGSVHSNRQRLFGELKEAIIKGGLEAYFQPQISLKDERLIGFELLARWSHPRNGILTPDEFIDVASEAGLVADIDATILQQGLDALVVMRARGYDVPRVSINASSQSLRDPAYPDLLMFELDSRNLTPEALAVEVLEETLIAGDSDIASKNIAKLHQAGFCVELDDFGSGYAAMSNLASLDISSIKIDKSLIEPLPQAANEAVVRAIIALCRELDLEVLAEGIETNEQVGILRELGCANAQGYWFGKPMTLQRMEMWLDGRAKTLEGFRTAKSA
ncbi:MAG: EAL domain-containing protein [Pseudomonadota bacterium]